jgi:molybdopterin synthase catalytic subunit
MIQSILITTAAIDEEALGAKRKISGRVGGVVTFQGLVRDKEGGDVIAGIEYEAFQEMAEHQFRKILKEVEDRWPIEAVRVVHRIGFVAAGEPSLWVEVSAAHRREAFEACEYLIDQMKVRAPIWKKPKGAVS